jgi:hypothetical protein
MYRNGQSSLVLRLDPPGLGALSVHVALGSNADVNVLFVPTVAQTAHLIHGGLGDLRQSLAASGTVRATDELRALVTFRKLNLIGNWPMNGRFHAIFCRNVVIYFDNETQARVWARFTPLLEPEGALYIGHSERISGSAERLLRNDGVTTYRALAPSTAAR